MNVISIDPLPLFFAFIHSMSLFPIIYMIIYGVVENEIDDSLFSNRLNNIHIQLNESKSLTIIKKSTTRRKRMIDKLLKKQKEQNVCVVCKINDIQLIQYPCKHETYCLSCLSDSCDRGELWTCPICRRHIKSVDLKKTKINH